MLNYETAIIILSMAYRSPITLNEYQQRTQIVVLLSLACYV